VTCHALEFPGVAAGSWAGTYIVAHLSYDKKSGPLGFMMQVPTKTSRLIAGTRWHIECALCDDVVSFPVGRFGAQWPKKWVAVVTHVPCWMFRPSSSPHRRKLLGHMGRQEICCLAGPLSKPWAWPDNPSIFAYAVNWKGGALLPEGRSFESLQAIFWITGSDRLLAVSSSPGKGKGEVRLITCYERIEEECRYSSTLSLTWALDGVGG